MSTTVKYFHADMAGAPTLNNAAGSLINVLDACLVDGFGLKSVDSLAVAANVATVTVSAGLAGYEADTVVLVSGSSITALNGEKRVLSATATTVTFAATGVSDGAASGTITMKIAPAGWAKAHSATNIAAYRSNDVLGTRMYLRVDDSASVVNTARVVGYEAMTDANTGTGPFPTNAQYSGGMHWPKVDANSATARKWLVIADGRTMYLVVRAGVNYADWQWGGGFVSFGDFASRKAGDAYACLLNGSNSDCCTNANTDGGMTMMYTHRGGFVVNGLFAARSYSGIGGSVNLGRRAQSFFVADTYSGTDSTQGGAYPNPADNSLLLTPVLLTESSPFSQRGACRGLYYVAQDVRGAFAHLDKIDGQGGLTGRKLMAVRGGSYANASNGGVALIDITGPWG